MLGTLTTDLINQVTAELKKEENQSKLRESLLDPIMEYLHSKVYTYLQFLGFLIGLIILLLIINVYLVLKYRK